MLVPLAALRTAYVSGFQEYSSQCLLCISVMFMNCKMLGGEPYRSLNQNKPAELESIFPN